MKLLLITNMYPSSEHKYYGTFVKRMTEILIDELPWLNCRVVSKSKKISPIGNFLAYTTFFLNGFVQLYTYKPDYVFIHFSSISSIAVLLHNLIGKKRFKLITHCHGTDIYGGKLNRFLSQKAFEISDYILVPSEKVKRDILKEYKIKCEIYITYSGGIDLPKQSAIQNQTSQSDKLKIGYVSTINDQKGFFTLVSAIKGNLLQNLEIDFAIAGFITDQIKFEKAINSLPNNINIQNYGLLPKDELEKVYATIDIFIFPTQLPESLGLVGLEAMSYGKPVIASKIGAIPEYLTDNENGFLFKHGDHLELSEKIHHFCTLKKEERRILCNNAKKTAFKFQSNKYRSILKMIIT